MYIHVEVVCMAVLKDDQFSVKKDLYAIWDSSRITFEKGLMTGAYVDIRLDQIDGNTGYGLMWHADRGELYENPSVNVTLDENNREVSVPVWYSAKAMNTMIEASGSRPDTMFVSSGSTITIVSFSGELSRRPDGTVEVALPPEGSKDFAKYGLGPTRHKITDYVDYISSEQVADEVREYNEEKRNVKSAFDLTKDDIVSVSLLSSQDKAIRDRVQAKTGLKSSVDHDMRLRFERDKKSEFLGRARTMIVNGDVVPLYPGMYGSDVRSLSDVSHDGIMRITLRRGFGLQKGDVCVFEGESADNLFRDIQLGGTVTSTGKPIDYGEKAVRDSGYAYCFCDSHELRKRNEANGVYKRERDDYVKSHDPVTVANKILADKEAALGDQSHVHKDVDNRQRVAGDKQVASSRKYYKNQPLIAVWDLKDVRRNKDGTVKGAYVDMQVDQSTLSVAQAKAGRGFASPSVHYAYSKNPEQKPNKVFYTKRQLDDILSVGSVANAGSKTGVSFTGNVFTRTNSATGKQTSWVLTPKDPQSAKNKEELDNIEWYNAENKLGESQHGNFTPELLKKHFMNTRTVREVQAKNARFVDAVKSVGERTGEQSVEDMSVDYED